MSHLAIAAEQAAEIMAGAVQPAKVTRSARQGDLILVRVGDATEVGEPTPEGGVVLSAGAHGEHRLVAERHARTGDVEHLPLGGVVVHTDAPHARHRALQLAPGAWWCGGLQELTADEVVVPVRE